MARKCCTIQTVNGGFVNIPIVPGGGGGQTTKIQRSPGTPGQPTDSGVPTDIIFTSEPFDELEAANLDDNTLLMVVPADGIYQVSGYALFETGQSAPIFEELRIMINGAIQFDGIANKTPAAPSTSSLLAVSSLQLSSGDTIGLQVVQDNVGALQRDVTFASLVLTEL